MIGVDPTSEGLELAADQGLEATHEGVDWLLKQDELPDLIFEATSAYVHREYAPRYEEAGIRAVDLTPAAVGPAVIPPVNGEEHVAAKNVNMITCGGQATIPMVAAVSRAPRCRTPRSSPRSSSVSAGPGHPREHRRVHSHHRGRRRVDRRRRAGQGDHHPQPGRAADDHARHDLLRDLARRRHRRGGAVDRGDGEGGAGVRPRLPPAPGAAGRRAVGGHAGPDQGGGLRRGRGCGRLPAAVLRQPRHHDRRRRHRSARTWPARSSGGPHERHGHPRPGPGPAPTATSPGASWTSGSPTPACATGRTTSGTSSLPRRCTTSSRRSTPPASR